MKRIVLVHGWGGGPNGDWFPWLTEELQKTNLEIIAPQLPGTYNPRIENWVPTLAKAVDVPDENTFFIGHSMGCQTIARYLATLPKDIKIGGVIFVAGFFDSLNEDEYDAADKETAKLWLRAPLDLEVVKSHIQKSIYYISEDDPDVPILNKERFAKELNSEVIILNGYKHFNDPTLPVVLEKILELTDSNSYGS